MTPTIRMTIIYGVASLIAGVLLWGTGCVTNGIKSDSFPPDIANQCRSARGDAIRNYTGHYGSPSHIPPVEVIVTAIPPNGQGAITSGSGNGYRIEIWRDQYPFYGSLVHEFEHTLKQGNGKGTKEGW